MRIKDVMLVIFSLLAFDAYAYSQDGKPDFSGTWVLDKEKTDLGSMGRHRASGGRMGGSGMGIPGMGIPGMGGPRMGGGMGGPGMGGPGMGGPGMGGPGMGGPGMGGPDINGQAPVDAGEVNRPRMVQIPESMVIEHRDPQLVIKNKIKIDDAEQIRELKYSTDDQPNLNEGPRGNTVQSKTHWKGDRLVTKSNLENPNGKMDITEVRSLSPDGKTMEVELKSSGGPGDWSHKLVYDKKE